MVAIEPTFEDIKRKFGTNDVRLPTALEIKSLALPYERHFAELPSSRRDSIEVAREQSPQSLEAEQHQTTSGTSDITRLASQAPLQTISETYIVPADEILPVVERAFSPPAGMDAPNEKSLEHDDLSGNGYQDHTAARHHWDVASCTTVRPRNTVWQRVKTRLLRLRYQPRPVRYLRVRLISFIDPPVYPVVNSRIAFLKTVQKGCYFLLNVLLNLLYFSAYFPLTIYVRLRCHDLLEM